MARGRNAVAALMVVLCGCQTGLQGSAPSATAVDAPIYTLFYDRTDHLQDLLATPDGIDRALSLVTKDWAAFSTPGAPPQTRDLLARLAAAMNARHAPALRAALEGLASNAWPAPPAEWPAQRRSLDQARQAVASYPASPLLAAAPYRAPEAAALTEALQARVAAISAGAGAGFAAFDHWGKGSFFEAYPVELAAGSLAANADAQAFIDGLARNDLAALAAKYEISQIGEGMAARIGQRYAALTEETLPSRLSATVRHLLGAAAARNQGLPSPDLTAAGLTFVEATSPSLLAHGQIDFQTQVDLDIAVGARQGTLDEAFAASGGGNLVVIMQVALAKASRRVVELQAVPSTLFVGFTRFGATTNANEAPQAPREGTGDSVVAPDAVANNRNLIGKPQALGEPVMAEYTYDTARIVARKAMTVTYYVIDRARKTYLKSTFDAFERQRFEVAYNIHRNDPRRTRLLQQFDQEKDVDEFEKAPMSVRLSQLLTDYALKLGDERRFTSDQALRAEIQIDRNAAIAAYKANTFDARPLNDPRFDSVVALFRGKRSMGSGFYVMPDVVLTNWHVVRDARFVEMQLFDGRETFGSVLGRDARLDLALIRVQDRGKPVRFRTDTKLNLGAQVEAIGHPHLFLFSITRGIVSAVRREYSINLPGRAGDKVLYVQTDAAINPGNSGGPLFLGDYVVGVNTWGLNNSIADNLSFSVHYSEVLEFLKEHLPGFQVLN